MYVRGYCVFGYLYLFNVRVGTCYNIIIPSVSYFKNIKFTFPPKFIVFTLHETGNMVFLGRQIHVININVIITFIGYLYTNN